jgi:hypothetical protein
VHTLQVKYSGHTIFRYIEKGTAEDCRTYKNGVTENTWSRWARYCFLTLSFEAVIFISNVISSPGGHQDLVSNQDTQEQASLI